MTLPELAAALCNNRAVCCREVGRGLLLAGYAGHNWLFATDADAARPFGCYGHVHIVETVDAALEIMGLLRRLL